MIIGSKIVNPYDDEFANDLGDFVRAAISAIRAREDDRESIGMVIEDLFRKQIHPYFLTLDGKVIGGITYNVTRLMGEDAEIAGSSIIIDPQYRADEPLMRAVYVAAADNEIDILMEEC